MFMVCFDGWIYERHFVASSDARVIDTDSKDDFPLRIYICLCVLMHKYVCLCTYIRLYGCIICVWYEMIC